MAAATVKDNGLQRSCSIGYDILTIVISLADVATDVIVLVGFYQKDRMVFFGISLAILILAQCSYAILFTFRYETFDRWNLKASVCCFVCLLPFGTFVAFVMYLASEDFPFPLVRGCLNAIGLQTTDAFSSSNAHNDNKVKKWIREKLNKHLGFLLEAAVEAFPQSLLQLIAIVYYKEANFIAIISILLSMFSVMTKSLILSEGLDRNTFLWSWACAVTDFFGIFFTVSWVFYTTRDLDATFLNLVGVFGQIWMYKFAIATCVMVAFGLAYFWLFGYWAMGLLFCFDTDHESDAMMRCGEGCLWFMFAPIGCVLVVFIACLGSEVFCFSIVAFLLYKFSSQRVNDFQSVKVSAILHFLLQFIANGKDKVTRIVAINRGIHRVHTNDPNNHSRSSAPILAKYIDDCVNEGGYDALAKLSYQDLRAHCSSPDRAAFFKQQWKNLLRKLEGRVDKVRNRSCGDSSDVAFLFFDGTTLIAFFLMAFVFLPVWAISKLLQILFPWFIIIYLSSQGLWSLQHIDAFQMMMLYVYIALQVIVIIFGAKVLQTHWYLWHIHPGSDQSHRIYWEHYTVADVQRETECFYEAICWSPQVAPILNAKFGVDIADIVLMYAQTIGFDAAGSHSVPLPV